MNLRIEQYFPGAGTSALVIIRADDERVVVEEWAGSAGDRVTLALALSVSLTDFTEFLDIHNADETAAARALIRGVRRQIIDGRHPEFNALKRAASRIPAHALRTQPAAAAIPA